MKKQILFAFFASLILMLSGCGSNDKIDGGSNANANKAVTLETSIDKSGRDFNISAKITKITDFAVALKNFRLLSVGGCEIESVSIPSDFSMTGGKGSYESVQFSGRFKDDCTPSGHEIRFTQTVSDGSRSKTETVTYDSTASSGGNAGGGGSTTAPVNGFFNATTPLVITQADHDYEIKIQVLEGGYAASGKTVKAKPFESQYGDIINPMTNTGADGYAVFEYKSPKILPANGSSVTVTLTNDENGTLISQDIVLQFSSMGNGGSQYELINASTPVRVTKPNETQEISVYVVDSATLIGVPNKQVSITTIENGYGSIDTASTRTDNAGKATFNYTSPADLTGLTRTTATLSFEENGVVLQQSVNIEIHTEAPTDKQSIQVLPLDSNVSVGSEAKPINVYVKDSTGRPAVDASVIVEFFNAKYGAMNKYEQKTDSNGHIEFVYIAPSSIDALDGQMFDFNVSLKSDPSIAKTVRIGFHQAVNVSPVSDIYIAPNDITIVRAGEERTIKITTVDSGNYAVSTNLRLENPTLNGKDYGSFDVSDFSTDALGNYLVTYTAPASLTGLSERNISVVELSTNLKKTLTLRFQQPESKETSYDLNLSVDQSIKVDGSGTLGIMIHETGKPNDLIVPANVKNVTATMKFPKMLKFDNDTTTVNYATKNINSFALHAEHLSGVAIIEVEATVFDGVNNTTLKQEFPVVITSGAISSISMFHASSSFDASNGVYQDLYTLHAVDKYGNPVNEGTALHPTLINGVKAEGTLGDIATGTPSVFTDTTADFSLVVDTNQNAGDRLIVIPAAGATSKFYLGDWSIKNHTDTSLTLEEQYDDVNTNGLTYAVGNENRVLVVNGKSKTSIADISSPDDNFKTDAQGNMQFVVSYDPDLKGKTFYLAANGPSDEKRIGTALKSSFFYGGYQLRALINEISLTKPGHSFSTGFYMLDSVGKTYTGQYNVFIDDFDASKGGFSIDNTTKDFQYFAPSNPDEFNALIGTTYEFNLTVSETDETFETIRVHYTSDTDYTNYAISSAESNFTIAQADQEHALSFYVSDGSKAVANEEVRVEFIDPLKGSMVNYTAVTDISGRALFTYKAPSDLALLYNNPVTINAYVSNKNTIRTSVTALFAQNDAYTLTNENDITISYAGESKEIAVQVIKNGTPQAGETVVAQSIPVAYGTISNASVQTGADGYARFTYVAATPLTDGVQPLELVHTDANGATVSTTVNITVAEKALYAFANESNLTIEHPSDQIDIKAQLLLKGIPVEGKTVQMEGFDVKYGSVFSYTVVTDAGGYATFAYTAPSTGDFDEVNGTTQTFKILFKENDKTAAETNATISFDKQDTSIIVPDKPIVVLPQEPTFHPLIIDANNKNVDIDIKVFKNGAFYTGGVVKVALPDEAIKGADVGLFDEYNVSIDSSGIAKFKYNGPSNLLQTLSSPDIDNNNSIFTFYHIENNITSGTDLTVEFRVPADTLQNRNYTLDVITNGEYSMGIPEQTKTFNVVLKAQDASGNPVGLSDENITKITVTSENAPIAQLLDGNATVDTLELVANTFTLKSKTLSGLVPIKVEMEFIDADDKNTTLETIVNVRVFSGPPSAISISYVSTGQDIARAKYIETLAISATDEYGNKVNTRPNISVGAIVGYAVDGGEASSIETSATKRLFYGRGSVLDGTIDLDDDGIPDYADYNVSGSINGTDGDGDDVITLFDMNDSDENNTEINSSVNLNIANGEIKELGDNDVATTNFEDNTPARSDVFQYVNAEGNNTDKLIVFGERKNYEAMGKWDISKGADNHTLALKDNYFGIDRSGLYYAVGHNYYQDQCREDGREWIGTTDSESYKLDEEGTVTVTYKYDYHLAGKDALIWVNLDGIQPDTGIKTRVGEATKHTLRSAGLVSAPSKGYTVTKGTRQLVEFYIWHEKAPERYRNAHFGYTVASGSTCAVLDVRSSNPFDARTCDNSQAIYGDADNNATTPDTLVGTPGNTFGGAYVAFYLEAPEDKDCTFNINGIVVGGEF